ncbi:Right handed beta helix region [Neorhodopirellula lusitana]|uniref:Right handed beta helix region n=1 Tax=Neorhodopirellula lusitana TaxID=445327 RepID=A0ABY1PT70_9BACT|nr:right-handed parallel beta-helix repeat-containing protein [Neorhodopirellula lusitana]SMP46665.1 Right handed beta helix region [Neorhodopirellula lusitana]
MHTSFLLTVLALSIGVVTGDQTIEQPAHSFPEYNQRFLENQLTPVLNPGKTFFVSPTDVDGDGTRNKPFPTLEAARDAIRELKRSDGLPMGGVHVVLLPGDYSLVDTFELGKQDSGTIQAPIVYRSEDAKRVMISAGKTLPVEDLKHIRDEETLERLKPLARPHVVSMGVSNDIAASFPGDGDFGMISMDGHLLTLSQWPNRGYNHISRVLDEGPKTRNLGPNEKPAPYSKENPTGGKFQTREPLSPKIATEFARTGDMQIQGYLHNDWYFQAEPVGAIDNETIQLLRYTRYGIVQHIKSIPRRVRLVNVLAELDEPGEWYFDQTEKRLYVWPIPGFNPATSRLVALSSGHKAEHTPAQTVSSADNVLIQLKDTSYVTVRDLTIENSGQLAVQIAGGTHNLIAACDIRNGYARGVAISGGSHNGITGCELHGLESAFTISGGDFKELQRCYNFATNNDIHSCRRRGYGMIGLNGVGIYFGHNVLHDMNGAVNYNTVDTLIEYNEFYNIGYEMGDFNVAYCGAKWHMMNNVVRYNFVHHLLEPGGHPVFPFRNDDGGMGLQIYGNVFYRSGRGGGQFHGPLNSFQNNITLKGSVMWWTNKGPITPKEIAAAWKDMEKFGRDLPHGDKGDNIYLLNKLLGDKGWTQSPWIDEFPRLAEAIDTNPFAQTFGQVNLNYINHVREPFHIHGGDGTIKGMESKKTGRFSDLPANGSFALPEEIDLQAFVDVPKLNFQMKETFRPMKNFKPIPFNQIGFQQDEFRPHPPKKENYRSRVYRKFINDAGGSYKPDRVNARYPKPSYLQ